MPHIALELGKNSASFGVKSAYGQTQEVDGAQFTPVALTVSGFGGGGIDGSGNESDASGGGGGGIAIPLGVYVKREEGLRFEPNIVSLLAVGVPFVWVAGRVIARIIRALKK
ncbi:hypothetical protein GCM10025768_24950 [Microbacterium pseudoresistens]|uniref:Putative spore protein YtfJ n=1 Tax=Microbacterium pseudoresistens TaxID=640634 RepID=A0A7Y9JNN1_9MICO|nr:hypothetical protein [Microbacterium pseudoresistens]NYD55296.1 putative spore protein YtfJ [Microbacterium pseudoresistens]